MTCADVSAEYPEGTPVWYSPSLGGTRSYAAVVAGAAWELGPGAFVVPLRELEPAYGHDRGTPTRTSVAAASVAALRKRGAQERPVPVAERVRALLGRIMPGPRTCEPHGPRGHFAVYVGREPRVAHGLNVLHLSEPETYDEIELYGAAEKLLRDLLADRDALVAKLASAEALLETERLRAVEARASLADVVRYEEGLCHSHLVTAVWDPDNKEGVRGKPCGRCNAFQHARNVLGIPGGPLPEGPTLYDGPVPERHG